MIGTIKASCSKIAKIRCTMSRPVFLDGHEWYVKNSNEILLREAVKEMDGIAEVKEPKAKMQDLQQEHKKGWFDKPLHGKTMNETAEFLDKNNNWKWLQKSGLKKETESTICAAQEQALITNHIKNIIDKQDVSPLCRMCGKREETIAHITSECEQLAGKHYKYWRHNIVISFDH